MSISIPDTYPLNQIEYVNVYWVAPQLLLYSHVFPYSWGSHVDGLTMSMTIFCCNPQILNIYIYIYLNLAGIWMATVLLNETPHFPVSPQPTWAVSTTCWNITKRHGWSTGISTTNHRTTMQSVFFYKNKQIKRTEEQHTTSPIHIFIPDAWFCLYPTVSDDLVLTRPQASI